MLQVTSLFYEMTDIPIECLVLCWLHSWNLKITTAGLSCGGSAWLDWPGVLDCKAWNQGRQIQGTKERMLLEGNAGTSLVVQWLEASASNAEGVGSIPGQEAKIPCALRHKN